MANVYVTSNSLEEFYQKKNPKPTTKKNPKVVSPTAIEEQNQVPNLETFNMGGYIKRTIQNCSCNSGESLV